MEKHGFRIINGKKGLYHCEIDDGTTLYAVAESKNEAYALVKDRLYAEGGECVSIYPETDRRNRMRYADREKGVYI